MKLTKTETRVIAATRIQAAYRGHLTKNKKKKLEEHNPDLITLNEFGWAEYIREPNKYYKASCCNTYFERQPLEEWCKKKSTCPKCRARLIISKLPEQESAPTLPVINAPMILSAYQLAEVKNRRECEMLGLNPTKHRDGVDGWEMWGAD